MESNSNFLTRWHVKLIASTLKNYQELRAEHNQDIKPHSLFTILAIFFAVAPLSLISGIRFDNSYNQLFILLLKVLIVPVFIGLSVVAFYNWRIFFSLRKDGTNKDTNLFFAESAGLYRKIIFYIALPIDFIRSLQLYYNPEDVTQRMRRLRYQARADYYHDAGFAVLDSIVLSILFIECLRLLSPKTSNWSDKKHWVVVTLMSLAISAFRVYFLHRLSGHGVF